MSAPLDHSSSGTSPVNPSALIAGIVVAVVVVAGVVFILSCWWRSRGRARRAATKETANNQIALTASSHHRPTASANQADDHA